MADEISFSYSMAVEKGDFSQTLQDDVSIDLNGTGGFAPGRITLTQATAVNITSSLPSGISGSEGIMVVTNLDSTNPIYLGTANSTAESSNFMKVKAGESYPVRLTQGATIYGSAGVADVEALIQVLED